MLPIWHWLIVYPVDASVSQSFFESTTYYNHWMNDMGWTVFFFLLFYLKLDNIYFLIRNKKNTIIIYNHLEPNYLLLELFTFIYILNRYLLSREVNFQISNFRFNEKETVSIIIFNFLFLFFFFFLKYVYIHWWHIGLGTIAIINRSGQMEHDSRERI